MSIKILIADDHSDTRKAVRALLEAHSGWEVCAEAGDGLEAVNKAASLRPDLVVLDFSMPRMNGLQAARKIHNAAPEIHLLLFSIHGADANMIPQFQSAGFRGTVPKNTAGLLPEAIESLLQGKTFFPPYPSAVEPHPADNAAVPTDDSAMQSAPKIDAAAPATEPALETVSFSAATETLSAAEVEAEPDVPSNGPIGVS
jgi:DNA-binding NarL/FixJ family response regulator